MVAWIIGGMAVVIVALVAFVIGLRCVAAEYIERLDIACTDCVKKSNWLHQELELTKSKLVGAYMYAATLHGGKRWSRARLKELAEQAKQAETATSDSGEYSQSFFAECDPPPAQLNGAMPAVTQRNQGV